MVVKHTAVYNSMCVATPIKKLVLLQMKNEKSEKQQEHTEVLTHLILRYETEYSLLRH